MSNSNLDDSDLKNSTTSWIGFGLQVQPVLIPASGESNAPADATNVVTILTSTFTVAALAHWKCVSGVSRLVSMLSTRWPPDEPWVEYSEFARCPGGPIVSTERVVASFQLQRQRDEQKENSKQKSAIE